MNAKRKIKSFRADTNGPMAYDSEAAAELLGQARLWDLLRCFQKQKPWSIQEEIEHVPSFNCVLPSRPSHSNFSCWDTGKSHPTPPHPRAFLSCVLRSHPHRFPFVVLSPLSFYSQ